MQWQLQPSLRKMCVLDCFHFWTWQISTLPFGNKHVKCTELNLGSPAEDPEMTELGIHLCAASVSIATVEAFCPLGPLQDWKANYSCSLQQQYMTRLWLRVYIGFVNKVSPRICPLSAIACCVCDLESLLEFAHITYSDCRLVCGRNVSVLTNQILHHPSASIITVAVLSLHLTA